MTEHQSPPKPPGEALREAEERLAIAESAVQDARKAVAELRDSLEQGGNA